MFVLRYFDVTVTSIVAVKPPPGTQRHQNNTLKTGDKPLMIENLCFPHVALTGIFEVFQCLVL